jgi:hypothetical protein
MQVPPLAMDTGPFLGDAMIAHMDKFPAEDIPTRLHKTIMSLSRHERNNESFIFEVFTMNELNGLKSSIG